jgi:hypothetical protein
MDAATWLTPAVVGGSALLAFLAAMATLWQKHRTDRRTVWWARTDRAIELSLDPDDRRSAVGTVMINHLIRGDSADAADLRLLRRIVNSLRATIDPPS